MAKCKHLGRTPLGSLVACLWLSFASSGATEQFVELNAEIEINNWSYWFFEDSIALSPRNGEPPKSVFDKSVRTTVRFVIGASTWMMQGDFYRNARVTRRFTGTNIIEHSIITAELPDPPRIANFPVGKSADLGEERTRVQESADGNPGRPVRVRDLMGLRGRIGWLAFCSAPSLKHSGRQLFPLDDLWKERCSCSGIFTDKTVVFQDALGLPKGVEIFTEKGQLIFQYQVRQSTNFLGWNIPLEFYLVQYGPPHRPRTNSWEIEFTAKGRVTGLSLGSEPSFK